MKLSKNFSVNELTKSQIAIRNGIDNTPNTEQLEKIKILVTEFLQPLRDRLGLGIRVTSGFRCHAVDEILAPGRSRPSQHEKGEAADFEVTGYDNFELATFISEEFDFDQLILEYYDGSNPNSGWIHCSYKASNNRKEILTASLNMETKKTQYFYGLKLNFWDSLGE